MKWIDSHTHLDHNDPRGLIRHAQDYKYEKFAVMSIPCCDVPLNNLECLRVKAYAPDYAYVYGGMVYSDKVEPTGKEHEAQLRAFIDMGCDGWKILESKAAVYRDIQIPLDSEIFDRAFSLAEEAGIPITWHAGDPATFWSAETAPEFAARNNWLCVGEGFPTLKQIYTQVENVMKKHPKLTVSLAHLYFTSDDRPHAERMLDSFENLRLDITPGSEMYGDFMADREGWYKFFVKYADRIVYGSDMVEVEDDIVFGKQSEIVDLAVKTLTDDKPFTVQWFTGRGLKLPEAVTAKIFRDNYLGIVGNMPKAISSKGLDAYLASLRPYLNAEQTADAETLYRQITETL